MFVQVMESRVVDAEGFRRHGDRWAEEVRPGAVGFLGLTAGVSEEGKAFAIVRFESAASAQANAARPEQGVWFAEFQRYLAGEPSFSESEDVEVLMSGGSDRAGFVQVMKGSTDNRALMTEMDQQFEKHAPTWRPDVLGGLRAWVTATDYVEVIYFTSEAEARANEQQPPPDELVARMGEFEEMTAGVQYFDITDPIFVS